MKYDKNNFYLRKIDMFLYANDDDIQFMTGKFIRMMLLKVFKIGLFKQGIPLNYRKDLYSTIVVLIQEYKNMKNERKHMRDLLKILQSMIYYMLTRINTAIELEDTIDIQADMTEDEGIVDCINVPNSTRTPVSPPRVYSPMMVTPPPYSP